MAINTLNHPEQIQAAALLILKLGNFGDGLAQPEID
jgi:hypothetical protein